MSLSRNTTWNVLGNALPLLVGAITVPLLIQRLGLERFGILTLLWTIIGYFSLFDFGIGRAITQQVAALSADRQHKDIPATIKAGLEFTILTGLLGACLLLLAAYPLSHFGLNISADLQHEVFISLTVAAIGIPLATLSTGFRGVLEGYEKFQASNTGRMFLGLSIFLFPFISILLHGASLIYVTLWLVGARLATTILFAWMVFKLPKALILNAKIGHGVRKRLFSFGAWMAITNLLSPLLVNLDRFVISYMLGASVVAYYTLPMEFLIRLLIFPGALGASLLPRLAGDHAVNSIRAQKTFLFSLKITAASMLVLCVMSSLAAYPLMNYFISADFANQAWTIFVILSIGVFFNGIAYIPYTALHARGSAKKTGLLHLLELIVYIPTLLILVNLMGLKGAAIAWTCRATLDAFFLYLIYSRQESQSVLP
jgi:O-antigen/teichoic acid export membrane protein